MKFKFEEVGLVLTKYEVEELEQILFSMGLYKGAMPCSRVDLKSMSQEEFDSRFEKLISLRQKLQKLNCDMSGDL